MFVTSSQKLSPRAGEVAANAMSRRKGNDSKLSSYFTVPPQSRLRLDSSPASGGAFWCSANSYVKPALKGEVDMSVSEWTEGLHRGFACLRQPLSQSALRRIASSPARGGAFSALYKLPYKTNNGDGFPSPQLHNLSRSPAFRRISHCESNISLRIRAISPCVSRISSRVSALPPTSSCYSRGSGCGTRAAVQWAVWAFVRLRAARRAHMGGARTAPHLRPAG